MRQPLLLLFVSAWLAWLPARALAQASQDLILGVSEGTSGGLDHAQVIAKYKGLADLLGQTIGKRVSVVFLREFAQIEDGLKTGRLDFLMARPSDYPATGARDHGYHFVASAKPDGQCLLIVSKGSPLKTLADARGKRWVLPEPKSYMARFCKAELRDRGIRIETERLQYVREQGAVGFYLENGFADIGGVASYSGVAKSWEEKGHRVLHRSVSQPYFPLVAGPRVSASQISAIQKRLAALAGDAGEQALLKTIGVKAFDIASKERLTALLAWLGE